MKNFLQQVIKQKKFELASGFYIYKRKRIKAKESFKSALKKPTRTLIAEIKKTSPACGILIKSDEKIKALLKIYNRYADAVSVVVDKKFFNGGLDLLRQVSQGTCLPVLAKDFIIDEKQIIALKNAGASSVLLILRILSFKKFAKLYKFCKKLKIDAVCEVSNQAEILWAKKLGADIFGINNRNLKTLQVDRTTAERLLHFIPEPAVIIAESGFKSSKQVKSKRIQAILVGTNLIKAKNLQKAILRFKFKV